MAPGLIETGSGPAVSADTLRQLNEVADEGIGQILPPVQIEIGNISLEAG